MDGHPLQKDRVPEDVGSRYIRQQKVAPDRQRQYWPAVVAERHPLDLPSHRTMPVAGMPNNLQSMGSSQFRFIAFDNTVKH